MQEIEINGNKLILPDLDDKPLCAVAADGGTIFITYKTENKKDYRIYIDRRISTKTYNHIYIDCYPEDENSIYVGYDEEVVESLLSIVN